MSSEGVKEGGGVGEETEDGEGGILGGADQLSLVVVSKPYGCDCKDHKMHFTIILLYALACNGKVLWALLGLTSIAVLVEYVLHPAKGVVLCQSGIPCQRPAIKTALTLKQW